MHCVLNYTYGVYHVASLRLANASPISVLTQPCAHAGRQSQISVLPLLSALTPYPAHNPVLSLRASERCNMVNPTRVNGARSATLTVWGCGMCSIESASEMRNFTFMGAG